VLLAVIFHANLALGITHVDPAHYLAVVVHHWNLSHGPRQTVLDAFMGSGAAVTWPLDTAPPEVVVGSLAQLPESLAGGKRQRRDRM